MLCATKLEAGGNDAAILISSHYCIVFLPLVFFFSRHIRGKNVVHR